jgi:hypothetical protein
VLSTQKFPAGADFLLNTKGIPHLEWVLCIMTAPPADR